MPRVATWRQSSDKRDKMHFYMIVIFEDEENQCNDLEYGKQWRPSRAIKMIINEKR